MDLARRLWAVTSLDPSSPAIEFEGRWTTWGELTRAVEEIDRLLLDGGVGAGLPVVLLARTRAESAIAFLALLMTKRCVVLASPLQSDVAIAADVVRLEGAAVIAGTSDWARDGVSEAIDAAGALGIELPPQGLPRLRNERVGRQSGKATRARTGVAVEMLTSGTTGPPKRIELTEAALAASMAGAQVYEGRSQPEPPKLRTGTVLTWNPLVHSSGQFDVLAAVYQGRRLVLLERFEPQAWADLVQRHGCKVTGMTPTALRMVLDAEIPASQLESLRAVVSGSARLEVALHEEWDARYGIPVLEVYGATEFAGGVAGWTIGDYRRFMPDKRGSQGRAQPGVALRVVDPESGDELAAGVTGLLEVSGAQIGSAGWLRTNDLASIDGDGFVWIAGRADDVIVRGGFKISPAKVASVLEQHPGVFEAAVVGVPDERLGEVPVAAVEVASGSSAPSNDELLALARRHLAPYEVPTAIRVLDALPRTVSTKASRPMVRALFMPSP